MAEPLLISWIKLIGQSLPCCGCMSNAGSWLLVGFRTEVNSACQFLDKYQVVWQHILEIELQESKLPSGWCIVKDKRQQLVAFSKIIQLLMFLDFLLVVRASVTSPLCNKLPLIGSWEYIFLHRNNHTCLPCRMQSLKQFGEGVYESAYMQDLKYYSINSQ